MTAARTALMRLLNQVEPGYLAYHFGDAYEIDTIADTLLVVHRAQVRPEVLHEAADKLMRIADEAEAKVAEHYGVSSGIGPGSVEMVREAARTVLSMADVGQPAAGSQPDTTHTPLAGQQLAGAVLHDVTDSSEATQPVSPDACTCMPHRKFRCGHCDMDLCQDCGQCCGCDCTKGGE